MSDGQPKTTTVKVKRTENGAYYVNLPEWVMFALYKASKIRSRKKRHIKKAVKRMFIKALYDLLDSKESSV